MSDRDLTDLDLQLIVAAREVIDANTDTDSVEQPGVHTMGAAVRDEQGRIHVGVNLAHFTGGPCAELVALGAARAAGARTITSIVAVGNHGRGVVGPCGKDRQILFDFHPEVRVLLPTASGVQGVAIEALLPHAAAWTVTDGTQDLDVTRFEVSD